MVKDLFSRIRFPYDKMLRSLENVEGYEQFCKFIKNRIGINNDWEAEIKALFEINKKSHSLIEICSHSTSEPDGVFEINNELGIIEAAFVRYLFNQNKMKRKLINRVENWLKPLSKYLTGKYKDYMISVIIFSLDVEPTDAELKSTRNYLSNFFRKGEKNMMKVDKFGIIMLYPENGFPLLKIPNPEVSLIIKRTGVVVRAYNVDLNKKIQQLLKDKRNQHKLKYRDNLKVYYFFIDCPIPRLREIDKKKVLESTKNKEVVVMCAVSVVGGKLVENKKIISRYDINNHLFDFSNEYYSS